MMVEEKPVTIYSPVISCIFCGFPFLTNLGPFGCPSCAEGDEPWPDDPAPVNEKTRQGGGLWGLLAGVKRRR